MVVVDAQLACRRFKREGMFAAWCRRQWGLAVMEPCMGSGRNVMVLGQLINLRVQVVEGQSEEGRGTRVFESFFGSTH